jgi:hypothetical protein
LQNEPSLGAPDELEDSGDGDSVTVTVRLTGPRARNAARLRQRRLWHLNRDDCNAAASGSLRPEFIAESDCHPHVPGETPSWKKMDSVAGRIYFRKQLSTNQNVSGCVSVVFDAKQSALVSSSTTNSNTHHSEYINLNVRLFVK